MQMPGTPKRDAIGKFGQVALAFQMHILDLDINVRPAGFG